MKKAKPDCGKLATVNVRCERERGHGGVHIGFFRNGNEHSWSGPRRTRKKGR